MSPSKLVVTQSRENALRWHGRISILGMLRLRATECRSSMPIHRASLSMTERLGWDMSFFVIDSPRRDTVEYVKPSGVDDVDL
jgi:hypothetical protein